MHEDFLHYLWKFKKFDFLHAKTIADESIQLIAVGTHNQTRFGPDFFNAKLKINEQLWVGNVEIHLKSSDWYAHRHEKDAAYDNVILHVVWEHDVAVFRKNNTPVPCLELKNYVSETSLKNYNRLFNRQPLAWINCENEFSGLTDFMLENWLERLYIERLEEKSQLITNLLSNAKNDWEAVLFTMLAKNFGLNSNGEAFLKMATRIPFSVIRKIDNPETMEALFFGQAGMLQSKIEDPYFLQLQKEYNYLKHKFQLKQHNDIAVNYFRLRPGNFPTLRLSQLANLYSRTKNLFRQIVETNTIKNFYRLFNVEASPYWKTHYSFGKVSKRSTKRLTSNFINLLIINTIAPIKFCYATYNGNQLSENIFELMKSLPPEKNSIVLAYNKLRKNTARHAMASQALLQLKPKYCDKNRCLQCHLGIQLLHKS